MRIAAIAALASSLVSCTPFADENAYTLYRNSDMGFETRVHVATFNVDDTADFNRSNCEMASRLFNANLNASENAQSDAPRRSWGFWCEAGTYSDRGLIPISFQAAFPTSCDAGDVTGVRCW